MSSSADDHPGAEAVPHAAPTASGDGRGDAPATEKHRRAHMHWASLGDAKLTESFGQYKRSWLAPFFGSNEPEEVYIRGTVKHPCQLFSHGVHECLESHSNSFHLCQSRIALFHKCLHMQPQQTVKTSYEEGSYVLDGCLCNGESAIALSLSNHSIRLYDTHTTAFLLDLRNHTQPITDIVTTPSLPSMLYSSQSDTGIMITDVRQGKAVHFLTDMCGQGLSCNTVGISPSGILLGVAAGSDIHLVDSRTWQSVRCIEGMHLDEVTRLRFVDEEVLCSAGEDQMINFLSAASVVEEDDMLFQAINCGEVITKMSCFSEVRLTAMIGTCENGYVCPFELEQPERRFDRPNFSVYLVDWCVLGGELHLVYGSRDDDGNAAGLSLCDWKSGEVTQLQNVHRELARVAIGFGDRFITGGEDGLLAFWRRGDSPMGDGASTHSVTSTASRVSQKERVRQHRESIPGRGGRRNFPPGTSGGRQHPGKPY